MKERFLLCTLLLMATVCSAAPVNIIFQGFHSPGLQGWTTGYPYFAEIGALQNVRVMCDDWAHGGTQGQTWSANYTDLGTINASNIGTSPLRFNKLTNALMLYDEAGWLLLQTQKTPQSQWTDINIAVWYTFDHDTYPVTSGAWNWLYLAAKAASNDFPNTNFHDVAIYTPAGLLQYDPNPEGPQELLRPVPDAATLLLVAGGLAGIMARKSRFFAG